MNDTTIEEILSLNENDSNDFQKLYDYLKDNLDKIGDKEGWAINNVIYLESLVEKFIQFAEPIESDVKELIDNLRKYSKELVDNVYHFENKGDPDPDIDINFQYQNLYSSFLNLYNRINRYFRNQTEDLLDFDGLINYDLSNKRSARSLIQEAVELIENDNILSEKSKKRILKYLTDAIQELNYPQTKWKNFLIIIKELVIVLGALGSLAGGLNAGNNLIEAKNKLENANNEIVNTSLNLNYMNVENTFNIQKEIKIQDNQIRMIEENKE